MPSGPPTWFEDDRRIREGAAPGRPARGSAGGSSHASNERPSGPSGAKPSRKALSRQQAAARVGRGCASEGSASQAVMWRMPRKRSPPARRWASSTSCDPAAQAKVGVADDAGAGAGRAVDAARAHRGGAVDELGLADRPHLGRARRRGTSTGPRRRRSRRCCGRCRVGQQVVEQIAPAGPVPEMVVRVDDRQLRLEDRLLPGDRASPGERRCCWQLASAPVHRQ